MNSSPNNTSCCQKCAQPVSNLRRVCRTRSDANIDNPYESSESKESNQNAVVEAPAIRVKTSTTPVTMQDSYVLFVNPIGLRGWLSLMSDADYPLLHEQLSLSPSGDPINRAVVNAANQLRLIRNAFAVFVRRPPFERHIKTAILSYTSALVVSDNLLSLAAMAVELMWAFFKFRLAARMAVARGTFTHGSFSVSARPWGMVVVNIPFLGSGIERAHRAEASPEALGLRVLVDRSAADRKMTENFHWCMQLPDQQCTTECAHEINLFDSSLHPTAAGLYAPGLNELADFAAPTEAVRRHLQATEAFFRASEAST